MNKTWLYLLTAIVLISGVYLNWKIDQLYSFNTEIQSNFGSSINFVEPLDLVNIRDTEGMFSLVYTKYNSTTIDLLYMCSFYPLENAECQMTLPIPSELTVRKPVKALSIMRIGQSDNEEMTIHTVEVEEIDIENNRVVIELYANSRNQHVINATIRFIYDTGV